MSPRPPSVSAALLYAGGHQSPLSLALGLETGFRDLKYTLGLVNLHGKSDSFAEQEIYASLTAFNFASRVCRLVVVQQPTEGIYAYKVNFKMAMTLCREFIQTPNADGEKLLNDIARCTVPIRPGGKTSATCA